MLLDLGPRFLVNQCCRLAKEGLLVNLTEDTAPRATDAPQRCTWSRNLHPNFCPGWGLNFRPLTWQSSAQPQDHRLASYKF